MRMRHGVFLPQFHNINENPTGAIHRDLELMEHLDRLGFHEAWIGEHHSAGIELVSSPELFIAAAAERTRQIRFGTGVISLPYHNPLMVANRIIQLDHQTRGRVMFGAGPGLLSSDAWMLGIDPSVQRDRMEESLAVILRLFRGEVVTETTDWYTLRDARTHLRPYQDPFPEVVVASSVTPSGGRLAGKYDLGMICVAADEGPGFAVLRTNWEAACEIAAEHGRTMDARRLRMVAPIHIRETREQAYEDARFGLAQYIAYMNNNQPRFHVPPGRDPVEWWVETQRGVIGTPDDAIALIKRLQGKQGDFGVMLTVLYNWVDFEPMKRSLELYQRYVVPHFDGSNQAREDSYAWVTTHTTDFTDQRVNAARLMYEKHNREREAARRARSGDAK
jgi:limonene 1,2-monooxygenase